MIKIILGILTVTAALSLPMRESIVPSAGTMCLKICGKHVKVLAYYQGTCYCKYNEASGFKIKR